MGSCLTSESRSPRANSTSSPLKRKGSGRRLGSRSSSFDQLHRTPGCVYANGASKNASLFTQQGKKGTNQDAMIVWEDFGSRTDTVFCGVFDGHGPCGHMVAKRVRDSLPLKLSSHWEVNAKSDEVLRDFSLNTTNNLFSESTSLLAPSDQDRASFEAEDTEKQPEIFQTLKDSFLKAFKAMDRELRMYASTDCFCSGTTAVTLVKQGQDIVIGNIGDSRAVLGTRDENNSLTAVQLTVDLKPDLPAEAERIRKCRGRVFALHDEPDVARVWLPNNNSPGLAMARAFGDFCLKDFGLISIPEVSYRRVTDKDEFIVLASDGIWDVLSNEEVVQIVGSTPTRSHCARALVQTAVKAWRSKYPTSKVDDCAVICLFLGSNESCFSSTEPKDKNDSITSSDDRSGVRGTLNETIEEEANDESSEMDTGRFGFEVGIDWSALEGVSRVNTLVKLPSFVPSKEDETTRGVNARK